MRFWRCQPQPIVYHKSCADGSTSSDVCWNCWKLRNGDMLFSGIFRNGCRGLFPDNNPSTPDIVKRTEIFASRKHNKPNTNAVEMDRCYQLISKKGVLTKLLSTWIHKISPWACVWWQPYFALVVRMLSRETQTVGFSTEDICVGRLSFSAVGRIQQLQYEHEQQLTAYGTTTCDRSPSWL